MIELSLLSDVSFSFSSGWTSVTVFLKTLMKFWRLHSYIESRLISLSSTKKRVAHSSANSLYWLRLASLSRCFYWSDSILRFISADYWPKSLTIVIKLLSSIGFTVTTSFSNSFISFVANYVRISAILLISDILNFSPSASSTYEAMLISRSYSASRVDLNVTTRKSLKESGGIETSNVVTNVSLKESLTSISFPSEYVTRAVLLPSTCSLLCAMIAALIRGSLFMNWSDEICSITKL